MDTSSVCGHPYLDDSRIGDALDLLPVGIAVWGRDGRLRRLNRAGAAIWGVEAARPPRLLAVDGAFESEEHPAASLLRTGRDSAEHHLLIALSELEAVSVRSRLRALRDASGAIVGVLDTFDRFEPARASSDRGERAYAEVADALPVIMWRSEPDGRTTSCNRRYWDYCGLERGTARLDWLQAAHHDDRALARSQWAQAVTAGTAFSSQLRLRRFDGSYHWFLARAWPVRAPDGTLGHWLGICTNIDELKRLELELRRCNEELTSFAGIASHDLQEPLRMVANFLDLLRRRASGSLDATALEYLAFAHDGARRMQELIRRLLDYARVVRPAIPGAPIDATAVAREAVLNLSRAIADSAASVRVGALPAVRVERVQLVQLMQNLIGNALKYRSAAPPEIDLTAERSGADWLFHVRDNGIGIPHADQERIFGLFQRLHGQGEYPGSGIGLAVCKKIVENYGGRIWVESEPGQGACFNFTLPAR